jgi:hypothetical protein
MRVDYGLNGISGQLVTLESNERRHRDMIAIGSRVTMDNSDISRRETFRLARFGALLAVGLGVTENGSAKTQKGTLDAHIIKGSPGNVMVKLYKIDQQGYELLKTVEVKTISWDKLAGSKFTISFIKGGTTLATLSDVMQKV